MEEKGYAVSDGGNPPNYNIKRMEIKEIPKQMLIGYMIEYMECEYQREFKACYIIPTGPNLYDKLVHDIETWPEH